MKEEDKEGGVEVNSDTADVERSESISVAVLCSDGNDSRDCSVWRPEN